MRKRGARFCAALPNQEVSRQRARATGTGEMHERGAQFDAALPNHYLTRRFHGNKPLGQAKCVRGVHRMEPIGVQGGFTAAGTSHWDRFHGSGNKKQFLTIGKNPNCCAIFGEKRIQKMYFHKLNTEHVLNK